MKLIDLQKCYIENFCPLCNDSILDKKCENCHLILDKHNNNYICYIFPDLFKLILVAYEDPYKYLSDKLYLIISRKQGGDIIYNSWEHDNFFKISKDSTFDDVKELLNKIYKMEVFK